MGSEASGQLGFPPGAEPATKGGRGLTCQVNTGGLSRGLDGASAWPGTCCGDFLQTQVGDAGTIVS